MHDVVIADDALVDEAADAAEIFGRRTPSLFRFSRSMAEATIVVGQEAAQDVVGGGQIGGADEAEFTGKAILKSAPQALDATLGLRAVGRNVGDAELRKSATKLGRLAFPRELFFDRPVVVVTHEDSVLVPIETEGDAVAAQQVAQQVEIPASIFRGKELGNGNLARGVVKEAEEGELWAAIFEPAMKAAIEEEHFALPSAAKTSLAVRRSAPLLGGAETVLAEQTAESLPTERATFHLAKLLAEMMIVETDIAGAGEMQDTVPHTHRKAARARPAATGVCQSRLPVFAQTFLQALDLAHAQAEQLGGSGTRHLSLDTC